MAFTKINNARIENCREVGPSAFVVYVAIARHVNEDGYAWPSATRIMRYTGMGKRSVWRAIQVLEIAGWIAVERTKGGGKLRNDYTILPLVNDVTTAPSDKTAPSAKLNTSIVPKQDHSIVPKRHQEVDQYEKDQLKKTKRGCAVDSPQKNQRFEKPSIQEVSDYCIERHNNVDAEGFVAYYESNGWKVGRNPMKDWKASVRTWERRNFADTSRPATTNDEPPRRVL
jgi:hypothetical protein